MQSPFASRLAKTLTPYVPGEQPRLSRLIKLNTNENPYPPAPSVLEAIADAAGDLRRYPDPESVALRESIAKRHGFGLASKNVFTGNGSDEVLGFSFLAFFDPDAPIVFPDITYSFYPVYAKLFSIPFREVPLNDDFTLDVEAMAQPSGGVIFANPNAPTSIELPLVQVRRILDARPDCVVLVDEAYIEFGKESAVCLVQEYPNLLVVKTFSKSHALAGLRVGYALGHEDLIQTLNNVKNSFNSYPVDRLAQAGATAAMRDEAYCTQSIEAVCQTRQESMAALRAMGFEMPDSNANFLFMKHKAVPAAALMEQLRARGVIVRRFQNPRIENYLRVTVGTKEEMQVLMKELQDIVK
ncbi:MAG: histidinol-phosphate transaminase [Bacillota bacterium]